MPMSESDASAEASGICHNINMMEGAKAHYDYQSDGYGNKFIVIIAKIIYVEDGKHAD